MLTNMNTPEVKMTPVNSTNLSMIGYDPKSQELHVIFKRQSKDPLVPQYTYVYSNVDPATFSEFMNAKSKGLYHRSTFRDNVRKYPFKKVRAVPPQL